MIYITAIDFAEMPGAEELAQVATAMHRPAVEAALMEATLRGTSTADWEAEEIADAADALQRISDQVGQAESLIDGFLAQRKYPLPLNPVPPLVKGWTRDITRYFLHKDRLSSESNDPIVRAYKDALAFLRWIAEGKFSLGAEDPILNDPNTIDVRFESDTKVFGRKELDSFR
jgi:phage gp36-like protein